MKILFQNILENYSDLNASNSSLNYPIENLTHPFLRHRFQSSSTSSIIIFDFDSDQKATTFFYGYYNFSEITITLKNSSGGVLYTYNVSGLEPNTQVKNIDFEEKAGIRSVEILISGSQGVFLGGVGLGCSYSMPYMISTYNRGSKDDSISIESTGGQNLQNYSTPKRAYDFNFGGISKTVSDEIEGEYVNTGKGRALYMEISNTGYQPVYAKILNTPNFDIGKKSESFSLQIQECR